jgi:2'-5' RNA ligase
MRLFVALDIDEAVRQRIVRFVEGVRNFAPEVRWVKPESLHVTLKFIGERPLDELESIKEAFSSVSGNAIQMTLRDYGFFPTLKSARVFWIGIESGSDLKGLAESVDNATAKLGIARDEHAFSPHLTLARGGRSRSGAPERSKEDAPNQSFRRLQEQLEKMPTPVFGSSIAREFSLYESKTGRGGPVYTKIASFPLLTEAGVH